MNSVEFIRYFREVLGDFFSAEIDEAKRFVLHVPDNGLGDAIDVPVFVRRQVEAQYPQIRMTAFPGDATTMTDISYSYSQGEAPYENPDIKYRRGRVDYQVRRSQVQIDIYSFDKLELYTIRDD